MNNRTKSKQEKHRSRRRCLSTPKSSSIPQPDTTTTASTSPPKTFVRRLPKRASGPSIPAQIDDLFLPILSEPSADEGSMLTGPACNVLDLAYRSLQVENDYRIPLHFEFRTTFSDASLPDTAMRQTRRSLNTKFDDLFLPSLTLKSTKNDDPAFPQSSDAARRLIDLKPRLSEPTCEAVLGILSEDFETSMHQSNHTHAEQNSPLELRTPKSSPNDILFLNQ